MNRKLISKIGYGLQNLKQGCLDLLFPPTMVCPLCGKELSPKECFCPFCVFTIRAWWEEIGCGICPGLAGKGEGVCLACRGKRPPFTIARATAPYDDVFRQAIYKLKFQGQQWLAEPLGKMMAERVKSEPLFGNPDIIVPIPLHRSRLRERGFNQSGLLASVLSAHLAIPLDKAVLAKVEDTKDQVGLSKEERWDNLREAFVVARGRAIQGAYVLLVDDIYTTGSTVIHGSHALLAGGADKVAVITWAGPAR